jgi:thioredoxin-like negative regulator of GroEL
MSAAARAHLPPERAPKIHVNAVAFMIFSIFLSSCVGLGSDHELAIRRGESALQLGDSDAAIQAFREALAARPRDPEVLLGLARAYVAAGDAEAALEIFAGLELAAPRAFASAAGDYEAALDGAARARAERGDVAGGLRFLRRLEERKSQRPGLSERLHAAIAAEGERLLADGRPSAAARLFEEVLAASPGHLDATLGLARSLIDRGAVDEAIRVLADASVRTPNEPRIEELMDRAIEIRYPSRPAKLSL